MQVAGGFQSILDGLLHVNVARVRSLGLVSLIADRPGCDRLAWWSTAGRMHHDRLGAGAHDDPILLDAPPAKQVLRIYLTLDAVAFKSLYSYPTRVH